MIERYRDLPFDGIGLMRIEFIISDIIGEHPLSLIESHDEEKFVDRLATGIAKVAREINPRFKARCLKCPPDPHPKEYWCSWEFYLD